MTQSEFDTIIAVVQWCIRRIREEADAGNYDIAADDVANKLNFFVDWLRTVEVER